MKGKRKQIIIDMKDPMKHQNASEDSAKNMEGRLKNEHNNMQDGNEFENKKKK